MWNEEDPAPEITNELETIAANIRSLISELTEATTVKLALLHKVKEITDHEQHLQSMLNVETQKEKRFLEQMQEVALSGCRAIKSEPNSDSTENTCSNASSLVIGENGAKPQTVTKTLAADMMPSSSSTNRIYTAARKQQVRCRPRTNLLPSELEKVTSREKARCVSTISELLPQTHVSKYRRLKSYSESHSQLGSTVTNCQTTDFSNPDVVQSIVLDQSQLTSNNVMTPISRQDTKPGLVNPSDSAVAVKRKRGRPRKTTGYESIGNVTNVRHNNYKILADVSSPDIDVKINREDNYLF